MKLGIPELWELEAPAKKTKTMPAKIADYCDGNTFGNVFISISPFTCSV